MFEEGQETGGDAGRRGRFAASLLSSVALYGLIGTGVVAATAAVKNVVAEEKLLQVEFTPPPEPVETPPPPPRPKPKQKLPKLPGDRQKVARDEMKPPAEIPDEVPDEAEGELSEAGEAGPVDGFLDGTKDGTGDGTQLEPEPSRDEPGYAPPRVVQRPAAPDYPAEARAQRVEGVVLVRCVVSATGKNEACRAIRGHELLRETAVRYVASFAMAPARKPDGSPDPLPQVFPVRFEARNL